ncbi:hypothetical protein GCM10025864_26790 [Luteimicrobium album]|uniref:Uncharacterized protein n=1 Tax=Luteimicrobium album TaxID=1054550 RepID=A0ABQ6I341_9MICO|nr:hypothetical protein [Luteimicrobium album]GMA24920.1 hypothetical protein GCM10025864_26790 [Luteimicrobium album]
MSLAASPQVEAERRDAALTVVGILDTALPPELGTADAPETYTVAAVFSRRVSTDEQNAIEDPALRDELAARFPGVTLAVSDRRLLIGNTNLAMLEGGLAAEIGSLLRAMHERLAVEATRRADEAERWRAAEAERAAAVKAQADRVRFT